MGDGVCWGWLVGFSTIPRDALGLLLLLCSGITPDMFWEPYWVPGIEPWLLHPTYRCLTTKFYVLNMYSLSHIYGGIDDHDFLHI